jgi:hypothetical protein
VRIATALSTTAGMAATDIPPFDPMRFFSAGEVGAALARHRARGHRHCLRQLRERDLALERDPTLRAGEREIIKVRPFVRIATALSTTAGMAATDILALARPQGDGRLEALLGERHHRVAHQPVALAGENLRWLAACVLTGMTGAGLIGSAIWVSLQGEVTFA